MSSRSTHAALCSLALCSLALCSLALWSASFVACGAARTSAASAPEPAAAASGAAATPAQAPSGGKGTVSVERIARAYNYRLAFGAYALEVDPNDGGRIVELSLNGQNALAARAESADAYGSSFWPSPQSDWKWPPPPELDKLPWQATVEGDTLVLESQTNAALGLAATQRIRALPEQGAVSIELSLHNRGKQARKVAPWQNTRMRPGGLTFFPSPGPAYAVSQFKLEPVAGVSWFQHDARTNLSKGKLFADGSEGWLAHVDRGLLFVKVFPEVPAEAQAPGEAEIELYVHDAGVFVEVEQQGAYVAIEPGKALHWTVLWLLRELAPPALSRAGDSALLAQARALAAEGQR